MISRFFLNRPVFASVIAILICFVGLIALTSLPVEQYPNITPPQILVSTTYRGADAVTVAQTVAAPLEQEINGVEKMIYMNSQSSSSGDLALSIFFEIGTDIDQAQINVQNKVNIVVPRLPYDVQRQGITIQKQSSNILLIVAVQSNEGRYDDIFISNYANINIADELKRIPGVSDVQIIGAREYSMRIWLNPYKMAQLSLTTQDIYTAIQEQNQQFALGKIGQEPLVTPAVLTVPVITQGRFETTEQFEKIILRAKPDGSMILLKDVARVELGAQTYDVVGRLNNQNSTLIAVYQQYGANALAVADLVKAKMEELAQHFPKGVNYTMPYDTTTYVKMSIKEVFITFLEAGFLVALVVLIFLQKFRATLIPIVAMIVSIVGTFAGMHLLGFSINTLTLFGLVLAIGMVVDDAIVVLENVETNIRTSGLPPLQAAAKAMDEVTAPVIATTLVLCAVFIPVAFLGGIAGQLYKQFAITISVSVIISSIVALTLSPIMAAYLIHADEKKGRFAKAFNYTFDKVTNAYLIGTRFILNHILIGLVLFLGLLLLVLWLFRDVPGSFVPNEDQGYVIAVSNLPENASQSRTLAVDTEVDSIALENPYVRDVVDLSGFSVLQGMNRTSVGSNFIVLKEWDQRETKEGRLRSIITNLYGQYQKIPEAEILLFNPPPIQGIGVAGGFEFWIQDRATGNVETLDKMAHQFIEAAQKRPEIENIMTTFETNSLQIYAELDRAKARVLGVSIDTVFQTLQSLLGTVYVNDFNKFGRVFRVMVQADTAYRATLHDISDSYVRSADGAMIPLSAMVTIKFQKGPAVTSRFNGFMAAQLLGTPAHGYTTGQAMDALEEVAREILPQGMAYAWGGLSYQEKSTGGTSTVVIFAGIFVVFLILAALYERWLMPFAILLAIPFGAFGALTAVWLAGMPNDIYFQIGLVTLIGLSAKNGILIVEFAMLKRAQGASIFDAAVEATKLRFRAIIMTSLTTIIGILPLVLSTGAGAASRRSVGMGIFGGMTAATFLAVLFVPLFYLVFAKLTEGWSKDEKQ